MKSIRFLIGAGAMLVVSGAAFAAEPWPANARPCAAMIDNMARLTCFDQLYAKATAVAAKSADAAAPAAGTTAAAGTAVVAGTTAVKSTSARTAGAAAIGDEDLKKSSAERAESGGPASVDAQITAFREVRPNVFRVTLDNGQVWQEEESQVLFSPKVGDTVRIKKGALGRHDISRLSNGKTGGWARVTRVK